MKFLTRKKFTLLLVASCFCLLATFYFSKLDANFPNAVLQLKGNMETKSKYQFDPLEFKQITEEAIDALYDAKLKRVEDGVDKAIDWSKYAYVHYVTRVQYMCLTYMGFSALLKEHKTRARLLLLISDNEEMATDEAEMMLKKIQRLNPDQVIIRKVPNIHLEKGNKDWADALSKFHIFNQVDFDRLIYMDSDAVVRNNMDELFFLPDYVEYGAVLAYWYIDDEGLGKSIEQLQKAGKSTNVFDYNKIVLEKIKNGEEFYNDLPDVPHDLYLKPNDVYYDIFNTKEETPQESSDDAPLGIGRVRFTSAFMVIKPKEETFNLITEKYIPLAQKRKGVYDMDLLHDYLYNLRQISQDNFLNYETIKEDYVPKIMMIPFTRYILLSLSLRSSKNYNMITGPGVLGYKKIDYNQRDTRRTLDEMLDNNKFIHYSEVSWKPWNKKGFNEIHCQFEENKPDKIKPEEKKEMCDIWYNFHKIYFKKKPMCGLLFNKD